MAPTSGKWLILGILHPKRTATPPAAPKAAAKPKATKKTKATKVEE
jgi:hypothetical protein